MIIHNNFIYLDIKKNVTLLRFLNISNLLKKNSILINFSFLAILYFLSYS